MTLSYIPCDKIWFVSDVTTRMNAVHRMWISNTNCTLNFINFQKTKA